MKQVEVYWDPNGVHSGKMGAWRARLKENHGYHAGGATREGAISDLLLTLKSFGLSDNIADYKVIKATY